MTTFVEPAKLSDVLKHEMGGLFSREEVTVLAGSGSDRSIVIGEVIGRRTKSSVAMDADPGNTGNGVPGAVTLGSKTQVGVYTLTCTAASADAGTFQVQTPDGVLLPPLVVAVAYTGDHVNLTLADGAADFVVGDSFTITISGDKKVTALDLTAVDGTQNAAGILVYAAVAPDGTDKKAAAIVRDAKLSRSGLVWPDGITADQKAAAISELESARMFVVEGA